MSKELEIRASSIPALRGEINYISEYQAIRNIIRYHYELPVDEIEFKAPLDHGNEYEQLGIEVLDGRLNKKLKDSPFEQVIENREKEYNQVLEYDINGEIVAVNVTGHIDGDYIDENNKRVLVEVKCPYKAWHKWDLNCEDSLLESAKAYAKRYRLQVQTYMDLGDYAYCRFVVAIKREKSGIEKVIDFIIEKDRKFNLKKLLKNRVIEMNDIIDNRKKDQNKKYWAEQHDLIADVPDELGERYNKYNKIEKDAKAKKDEVRKEIGEFISGGKIKGNNKHILASKVDCTRVNYSALIKELKELNLVDEDLLEELEKKHSKTTETVRITAKKGE